eukprot:9516028-Karenia_brevis.AAC.1
MPATLQSGGHVTVEFPAEPIPSIKLFETFYETCYAGSSKRRLKKIPLLATPITWDLGSLSDEGPLRH